MCAKATKGVSSRPDLVVQVEVVKLAVGSETLRVLVQGEVHATAVSLDPHGMPLVIVQQAAAGHRGVTLDGAILIATWSGQASEENTKKFRDSPQIQGIIFRVNKRTVNRK